MLEYFYIVVLVLKAYMKWKAAVLFAFTYLCVDPVKNGQVGRHFYPLALAMNVRYNPVMQLDV